MTIIIISGGIACYVLGFMLGRVVSKMKTNLDAAETFLNGRP